MRKALRIAMVAGAIASAMVFGAGEARAACHSFTIDSTSPNPVTEGGSVTVTVRRDAAVQPSSVRLRTLSGSAIAGQDFNSVDMTVSFTNQLTKNVAVKTINDASMEGTETFKLHLSDGGGCPPNTDFEYGMDKTVTIKASDQVIVQPSAAPTQGPTAAPIPTDTPTPSPSPSPSPTPSGSPSPTPTFTPIPSITPFPDEGGLSGLAIAGIILGAGALGSGGVIWYLRRRAAGL